MRTQKLFKKFSKKALTRCPRYDILSTSETHDTKTQKKNFKKVLTSLKVSDIVSTSEANNKKHKKRF
jgi:hypothetical protein